MKNPTQLVNLYIIYARSVDVIPLIVGTFSNVFMRMTLYPRILKMMDEVCEDIFCVRRMESLFKIGGTI